jgi:uncharacterized membrane protein SpoIIM required for sporulation
VQVAGSLKKLRWPVAIMTLLVAAAFAIGYRYADIYPFPAGLFDLQHVSGDLRQRLQEFGLFSASGVGRIIFQNVRAALIASALGVFSFGVLAAVIFMLPGALAGYFAGQVARAGNSPWLFLAAFILPHGILEIPALILCGAATLHLGASLISPPPGKTVMDGWLIALADWAKIFLGLVLPMLAAAAALEVFVTPGVVVALLGG